MRNKINREKEFNELGMDTVKRIACKFYCYNSQIDDSETYEVSIEILFCKLKKHIDCFIELEKMNDPTKFEVMRDLEKIIKGLFNIIDYDNVLESKYSRAEAKEVSLFL